MLKKTLENPLDCKEIKPVNPKGDQPWTFIGRTDGESEAPILWSPDVKSLLNGKSPDSEKYWGQKEKGVTEDEMVGWHHQLNGHEFQETPGDSEDREAWSAAVPGVANNWTWLSNWITARHIICKCFSPSLGFYFLYGVLWYTSLNFDEVQCIYSFFCYLYQCFWYISKKTLPNPKLCIFVLHRFSRVWLFAILWTVAQQAPLSMGFSRQEYWSGLPCSPPGDRPSPAIEPLPLRSPALAGRFFTASITWEAPWIFTPMFSFKNFIILIL